MLCVVPIFGNTQRAEGLQIPKDARPGDVSRIQYLQNGQDPLVGEPAINKLVEEGLLDRKHLPNAERQKRQAALNSLRPNEQQQQLNTDDALEQRRLEVFNALDKDTDGFVTQTEFFNVIAANAENEALWKREDKNGDGVISFQEFDGPGRGSGSSSSNENDAVQPQTQQQPAGDDAVEARRLEVFQTLDSNGDGSVTPSEFFSVLERNEKHEALWGREDKNGDGVITVDEFDGDSRGSQPAPTPPPAKEEVLDISVWFFVPVGNYD